MNEARLARGDLVLLGAALWTASRVGRQAGADTGRGRVRPPLQATQQV